jgi:hypothetical protein
MNDTRIPKLVYENIRTGKRNVGTPRKRWIDQKSMKNENPRTAVSAAGGHEVLGTEDGTGIKKLKTESNGRDRMRSLYHSVNPFRMPINLRRNINYFNHIENPHHFTYLLYYVSC